MKIFSDFYSREEAAAILRELFDRRQLWQDREKRRGAFRQGEWWTWGSALYLDLNSAEELPEYHERVRYWNALNCEMHSQFLQGFLERFSISTGWRAAYLPDEAKELSASYPGFHIFPGFETFGFFFGKKHQDFQWKTLMMLPGFPDLKIDHHFSFTLPFKIPYLGAALLTGESMKERFEYRENSLYVHSGQFDHAIAPYKNPVLPFDWRITLQGHGFVADGMAYLYW